MSLSHIRNIVVLVCLAGVFGSMAVYATGDNYTITSATSTYAQVGVALAITDVQIEQFAGDASSTIPVSLAVSNGTLALGTTTGLSFTGGQTGATIQFRGTLTNVNAALQTLTYTRNSTGSDTLEVSLVEPGEVFLGESGHLYEFITGSISWTAAKTAAEGLTRYGATGYLATITSEAENDFVVDRLVGDGWIGASDAASEGDWKWVTGPEAGTSFWSGTGGGSSVSGRYQNWAFGEPNDHSSGEDCGQLYITNGNWNDLPCSTSIAGYVVEFGADGDAPNVASRNITITTINAPVIETLSPADNATAVVVNPDLVLTFDVPVVTSTGSFYIKLSSDNSIVESIVATSSQITGGGTDTITITPSVTLAEQTAYYITIDATTFTTTSSIPYAGISSSSTWNFTTGDFTPPVITLVTSTVNVTTSTITWTTDELASSRVRYGVGQVYSTSTPESDMTPRVLTHSVSLTELLSCTNYVYYVESIDASTNVATSTYTSFRTTGCVGSTEPTSATSTPVTVASGATSTLATTGGPTIQVYVPPNSTTSSDTIVIQVQAISKNPVYLSTGVPSGPDSSVGAIVFDVKAIINGTTILDSFDSPVTITYSYSDDEISGLDESSLRIYHYSQGAWSMLDDCVVYQGSNTVQCTTQSFSIFGIFGDEQEVSQGGGSHVPPSQPVFTKTGATPMQGVIAINQNDETTMQTSVLISIYATNVAYVALSESSDFAGGSYLPYSGTIPFVLSSGDGTKTVYAKLLSPDGGVIIVQDSIVLKRNTIPTTDVAIDPSQTLQCTSNVYLVNAVKLGARNNTADVRLLEEFLNTYEQANLTVNGIYEQVDVDAVVRWQEKYAPDILTPWGLTKGTGYVYTTSLKKIKQIHTANCATAVPSTPQTVAPAGTTACLNTSETLRSGMSSALVVTAQQLLQKLGFFPADVDTTGYFGTVTQSATVSFQTANGIDRVGFIGPQTRSRLNELAC